MIEKKVGVEDAMKALGIAEVDESDLESLCAELIAANPKVVEDVKQGKLKAAGSLIGQAKQKNPNVNATRVREICLQLIEQIDAALETPSESGWLDNLKSWFGA